MSEIGIPAPPVTPTPPIEPTPPPEPITAPFIESPPAPEPPTTPAPIPEPTPGVSGGGGAGLSDLLILAGILAALGFAQLFAYLTDFFNWLFRLIFGSLGQGSRAPQLTPLQWGKPLTNAVGKYVTGVDAQVGADFAALGQTVSRVGRAILAAELTLYHAVARLLPLEGQVAAQSRAAGHLSTRLSAQEAAQARQATQAAQAQARALQRSHGLAQRLTEIERDLGAVVQTQHELVHHAIPQLRRGQATAWDEIVKHNEALGLAGFTLGVAGSLANLGGNWIRCESSQAVGEAICRSNPSRLRNLLHDLLPLIGIAELCGLVKLVAQAGRNPVILATLGVISTGVEDLLTCTGATKPTPLVVPAPSVGPPIAFASLTPVGV